MTSNKSQKFTYVSVPVFILLFLFYFIAGIGPRVWLQIRRWRCEKVYVVLVWLPYVTTVRPLARLLFVV